MSIYLSVIIPAYNEEKRLPTTLLAVDKYLSEQTYPYEILVVNDGSKDSTVKIVKNFQRMIKNLIFLEYGKNRGKGYAVRFGMLKARGKYRLFTDADNSTSVNQVEKLLPYLKPRGDYDIAIGSRAVKGHKILIHQPLHREIIGKTGNKLVQVIAVPGIKDTQCGFKCFTKESAENIFPKQTIEKWGFDFEVLAIAKKLGLGIKEVPIVWIDSSESKLSKKAMFSMFYELMKVRINLWRKIYD